MRKFFFPLIFIIFLGFLLIPEKPNKNEIQIKNSILQKDVEQTSMLCRTQCTHEFLRVLSVKDNTSNHNTLAALEQLQNNHPHMTYLIWLDSSQNLKQGVQKGHIHKQLYARAYPLMEEALDKLQTNAIYQSPTMHYQNKEYFVLGTASKDHNSYLIGLVQQDILDQIAIEQRKNLRMVPYPSDKRYKIKSANPKTLNKVRVRNAEDNEGVSHYHNNQVVVKFRNNPSPAELSQIQKEIQSAQMKKLGYTYVFQSKQLNADQLIKYFKKRNIEYVEPHFLYMTNSKLMVKNENEFTPNDLLFEEYQWNLPVIDTLNGWHVTRGSEDIIVAVIDTGVDLNHTDLKDQLVNGINIVDENSPPMDDVGHGTHVAGVISAVVNNTEGVAGMSWYNKVMPIKALDHTGAGSTYSVAQGVIWATDHGANVINMSLGNYANAEFLHDAIKYAFDHDVVLVAATGNDNTENSGYPAAYPEVLAVSATDPNQDKAFFSNYGEYVDVVAPGENIASTYPDNQYASLSGTSMASPHVAALAAMIRSANPLLINTEVMEILRQTSVDLGQQGKDKYFGFGQIDVTKALEQAEQTGTSLTLWSHLLDRLLNQIDSKYK